MNNKWQAKIKQNQTPLLIIGLAILTGLLVIAALSPQKVNKPNTQVTPTPVTTPADTALSFANLLSANGQDSADIVVNSGNNKVTGVQIELSFDPRFITNVAVTPGDFMKNPIELFKKIDYTNGRVTYVLANSLDALGVKGKGTVAKLTFTEAGAKGQQISIKFLPKTLVTTQGYAGTALKSTSDLNVVIGGSSATTSGQ